MEIFFDVFKILLMLVSVGISIYTSRKMLKFEQNAEFIQKKDDQIIESLFGDVEGIEKAIVILSQKVESIPNIVKDDAHRSMLALRDLLETTKPIKPNNWDSMKEAFKGPVRIEVNERN